MANNLYHNNGDGTFKDGGPFSGAAYSADGMARAGMGVDAADYDQDGHPDILITNFSLEGAGLYRNGPDNLFTDVTFQTPVGAKIKIVAGNLVRTEEVRGGSSYLSSHDLRVNLGLGARTQVDTIEIQWPSGALQKLKGIKANQIVNVREP